MAAQGKINTAHLAEGSRILVRQDQNGHCWSTKTKGGSVVFVVKSNEPIGNRQRRVIGTVDGKPAAFTEFGIFAHHVATDRDDKRVKREARERASARQAAQDSAAVLDGVTLGTITVTESGIAEIAKHTGETPAQVRAAVNAQPDMRTERPADVVTPGTVRRGNRELEARHIRTTADNGTVAVTIELKSPATGKWLPASKTVAGTFKGEEPAPAPVLSLVPRLSEADKATLRAQNDALSAAVFGQPAAAPAKSTRKAPAKRAASKPAAPATFRDRANALANFRALAASCRAAGNANGYRFWVAKVDALKAATA